MRPLLTVMATNIFVDDWQKSVKPALGVEVFHNFTLMHDDIMDAAPLRRGKPTVHEKWDTNVAILSGDVMLVCAYELMTAVDDKIFKHVIRRFNRTAAEVCEGQQWDMNFATRNDVTEEEYINMIRLKTSVLLGFALELGGLIAEAGEEATQLLYDFGTNIGIGFQLKDDILDVYGDPEKFGKQVGGDIIENKKTYLYLKAMEFASANEKEQLLHLFSFQSSDKTDKINSVKGIFNQTGASAATQKAIENYTFKALETLAKMNIGNDKKAILKAFAENLMSRNV
jgi:geranylgeranyl diphosphate synthase type II